MKKITTLLILISQTLIAQVGIGTTNPDPASKLDVNGITKTTGFMMPTNATNGAVLTSDGTGIGTWKSPVISNVIAILSSNGVNIPSTTTNFLQTGGYIDLPVGKFAVNVTILMRTIAVGLTPPNSSFFVRTSFSDTNTANPVSSNDIVGGKFVSGNLNGSSYYEVVNGAIIINNTSGAIKRYYFIAGRVVVNSTTQTLEAFGGSSTDENRIIAYRIN